MEAQAWDPKLETFGAYLRGKNLHIAAAGDAQKGLRAWDSHLEGYAGAVRQGIEPDSTNPVDVQRAVRVSDSTGVAYGV